MSSPMVNRQAAGTAAAPRAADAPLAPRSGKLTLTRQRILDLLLVSDRAVSAYELVELYNGRYEKGIKPMSVYRCLAFLCHCGLAHRIHSCNRYTACSMPGTHRPDQHRIFYCDSCGRCEEQKLPEPLRQENVKQADRMGFSVLAQYAEIRGVCPTCRNARK